MLNSAWHSLIVLLGWYLWVLARLSCTVARNVLLSSVNSDKYPMRTAWCSLLYSLFTNLLASAKVKDLNYTTATHTHTHTHPPPPYAFMACKGIALLTSPRFSIFLVHDGPLFIVSYFNILIPFCGSLGVVNRDECLVLLIHVQISVLSYIIP